MSKVKRVSRQIEVWVGEFVQVEREGGTIGIAVKLPGGQGGKFALPLAVAAELSTILPDAVAMIGKATPHHPDPAEPVIDTE